MIKHFISSFIILLHLRALVFTVTDKQATDTA